MGKQADYLTCKFCVACGEKLKNTQNAPINNSGSTCRINKVEVCPSCTRAIKSWDTPEMFIEICRPTLESIPQVISSDDKAREVRKALLTGNTG